MSKFAQSLSPENVGTLKGLAEVTKLACDAMAPMISKFYYAMNNETSTLKEDKSVFTIADGTVQHLLVDHLYTGGKFKGIVGEEECEVNLKDRPFKVDNLTIPEEFCDIIEKTRDDIQALARLIKECPLYSDLTVFIDPIDGTREFASGKGEQCSVCVGFSDSDGQPQAGLVYRPITSPPTFAAGAKSEGYALNNLDKLDTPVKGLLTSNGGISDYTEELMKEMGYARVPSGGAGNKILMLLEGKGSAYIQDRGVSRWDTAGAQACIEAHGGICAKLSTFVADDSVGSLQGYTYLASDENSDFTPGTANLTPYNAANKNLAPKKGEAPILATDIKTVKPYANLCGLFAVGAHLNSPAELKAISAACQKAKSLKKPVFD